MAHDKGDTIALFKDMVSSAKLDSNAYDRAMIEARQALEDAEIALGIAVRVSVSFSISMSISGIGSVGTLGEFCGRQKHGML